MVSSSSSSLFFFFLDTAHLIGKIEFSMHRSRRPKCRYAGFKKSPQLLLLLLPSLGKVRVMIQSARRHFSICFVFSLSLSLSLSLSPLSLLRRERLLWEERENSVYTHSRTCVSISPNDARHAKVGRNF